MKRLSSAEEQLSAATVRLVEELTAENLAVVTVAANDVLITASQGIEWLNANPAPNNVVAHQMNRAFVEFRDAAQILIDMGSDPSLMMPIQGNRAASAIASARAALYDATVAYVAVVLG